MSELSLGPIVTNLAQQIKQSDSELYQVYFKVLFTEINNMQVPDNNNTMAFIHTDKPISRVYCGLWE